MESTSTFRSRLNVCRGWLLRAGMPVTELECVLQLAIGLENGLCRESHLPLWQLYHRGERHFRDQTVKSLCADAQVHLQSNVKHSPEHGVLAVVPPPPALRPTGVTMGGSKARAANGDNNPPANEKSNHDSSTPGDPVNTILQLGELSDDDAKHMHHTFRCPFHLIPWKGNKGNQHFLSNCPVLEGKHQCQFIGTRKDGGDAKPEGRARNVQFATDEISTETKTDENGTGKWMTVPGQFTSSCTPVSTDNSHTMHLTSNRFTVLQDQRESDEAKGGEQAGVDSCVKITGIPNPQSRPSRSYTHHSQRSSAKRVCVSPAVPGNATFLPGRVRLSCLIGGSKLVRRCLKAALNTITKLTKVLCVDSGSTHDMTQEREAFVDCVKLENTCILAADNAPVRVAGKEQSS